MIRYLTFNSSEKAQYISDENSSQQNDYQASITNPVLLILDEHAFNVKKLDVIDLATENNVHILWLTLHCLHMMQFFEVGCMKPVSTYYTEAVGAFQRTSDPVAIQRIFGILGSAFRKLQSKKQL
ncbi:hypothetical protein TKK_0017276 [Trichogramma kaykai]